MKITQKRIEETAEGGCMLLIACIEDKYIYSMYGAGELIKLACEQAMIENDDFNELMKKSWARYNELIISN